MSTLVNNPRRIISSLIAGVFVATLGALGAWAQTPPLEDACLGALVVVPGDTMSGETFNIDATRSPDDPDLSCTMGPGFGSVFLEFVATETSARIRTDLNSFGLDSDFAVYDVVQFDQCDTSQWIEVGCSEDNAVTLERNTSTCVEGLTPGLTYKIMLSSFTAGSSGDYTVEVDGPCTSGVPAVCGDGFIDDGEQCDDSNVVDGDGCSAICEIEGGPPGPTPDTTDPVITVPGNINVFTDPGLATAVVNFDDATATDDSGSVMVAQIAGPASGSAFPLGPTTVTFEATDPSNNTAQGSFTVTVTDNEDPVISVPGDIVAEATGAAGAVVVFPFATATDNSGAVVVAQTAGPVSGSTFPIGATVVTFEATDPSGNKASDSTNITVVEIAPTDLIPPVVTAPVDKIVEATGPLTSVAIGTATAVDLVDGNVTPVTPDNVGPFPIGTTVVTWSATDAAGNTGTATQNVTLVYIFGQFLPPLEDGKIYKVNRTLPVKFQITFVGGELVEEATVGIEVVMLGEDDTPGEPIDLSTLETADTGGLFRFTDGQYIFNLSTRGFAPGKYRIIAILSNGQAPFIDIILR